MKPLDGGMPSVVVNVIFTGRLMMDLEDLSGAVFACFLGVTIITRVAERTFPRVCREIEERYGSPAF